MCIQLMPDERIIVGYDDWSIKIWNLETNDCVKTLEGHSDQVWMLRVYSNEKIISASADKTIKIWNFDTGEFSYKKLLLEIHILNDCLTGDCLKTLKSHTGLVYWIEILSNDRISKFS